MANTEGDPSHPVNEGELCHTTLGNGAMKEAAVAAAAAGQFFQLNRG